jgi:hypothetical protein
MERQSITKLYISLPDLCNLLTQEFGAGNFLVVVCELSALLKTKSLLWKGRKAWLRTHIAQTLNRCMPALRIHRSILITIGSDRINPKEGRELELGEVYLP